jgi:hypothetical protein
MQEWLSAATVRPRESACQRVPATAVAGMRFNGPVPALLASSSTLRQRASVRNVLA